jgi:glycosyltransferase involved in cell wall biosynthesis
MPSVLILCEYAALNGGEQSMLSTLDGIARAGYQVRVAAPASGPLAEALRGEGVEVVPFELHDARGARLPLAELRRKLAEILKSRPPALLHANSLAMGRLSGPVAAELALPSLSHLRDIVTLGRQAIADLNCHGRLLAVSQATRQFQVAQGLPGEKTFALYNGVDLERFRPRPPTGYLRKLLGLARGVPLIGTIGQISLRKGQDVLAAALAQLPSPSGRGAGGGPLKTRYFYSKTDIGCDGGFCSTI